MPKYLCIQRSTPKDPQQDSDQPPSSPPSPAQMEQMYAKFNAWKDKFQDNIIDMGGQLSDGKMVRPDGVTDGPFVEAKEIVGGFMIVEADTIELAAQVAQESPGVFPGASVEVRLIKTP
ncbi:MAG: YciI family protein [Lysobacterales bacterium]